MADNGSVTLRKEAELTPKSDREGHVISMCAPDWFDPRATFKIANAPERTASLVFTGADLNFVARVLYAEASGSMQLPDKAERAKEKAAIMAVNHFRLNRRGYPNNAYVAKTFEEVCRAPNQFESVFDDKQKFGGTEAGAVAKLSKYECADLDEAIEAVRHFMNNGPEPAYQYDNFRGYRPNGNGTHIGRSRFWLSPGGRAMMEQKP